MNGPRIVLILLAVFAVLFVVGVGMGGKDRGEGEAKQDPEAYVKNNDMPEWSQLLGRALDPLTPKVKPQRLSYTLSASAPAARVSLPAGKEKHRKASFTVKGDAKVDIVYEPPVQPPPDKADEPLLKQRWPTEKTKDFKRGSFLVLPGGGALKITLRPGARTPCTVEFE
jgi:hypothetical protein